MSQDHTALASLLAQAISPKSVQIVGLYTQPRSWGVYRVDSAAKGFRFGNHPVRMQELEREFGRCVLVVLFADRDLAREAARQLNRG